MPSAAYFRRYSAKILISCFFQKNSSKLFQSAHFGLWQDYQAIRSALLRVEPYRHAVSRRGDNAPANAFTHPSACLPGTNTGIADAMAELFKTALFTAAAYGLPAAVGTLPINLVVLLVRILFVNPRVFTNFVTGLEWKRLKCAFRICMKIKPKKDSVLN